MTYVLCTLIGVSAGVVTTIVWFRWWRSTIYYPIVPKWSHFKAGDRIFDGDRWTGEDDAA